MSFLSARYASYRVVVSLIWLGIIVDWQSAVPTPHEKPGAEINYFIANSLQTKRTYTKTYTNDTGSILSIFLPTGWVRSTEEVKRAGWGVGLVAAAHAAAPVGVVAG